MIELRPHDATVFANVLRFPREDIRHRKQPWAIQAGFVSPHATFDAVTETAAATRSRSSWKACGVGSAPVGRACWRHS